MQKYYFELVEQKLEFSHWNFATNTKILFLRIRLALNLRIGLKLILRIRLIIILWIKLIEKN